MNLQRISPYEHDLTATPEPRVETVGEVRVFGGPAPTGRWGDDHKHGGVPVHPGCAGCQSCFGCLIDDESECYVPITDADIAAMGGNASAPAEIQGQNEEHEP